MAEALNSVYKAELFDRREWSGQVEVMADPSRWVGWYNAQRLHSALGYRSPAQVHRQWTERTLMDVAAA
ncbi:integrase core domain-containing protein [Glutamicibacter arilaitensis]|uniref:integrase core domain-containing protein n=1 Tax=Glutamicibacter arilaitensis TaxID=256701 RepID=UPI003FD27F4F